MKVNIVTENLEVGRIKRRISEKIINYNTSDIEYSMSAPRNDVDLNFYLCYNEFLTYGPSNVKNVCWVTHIHKSIPDHEKEIGRSFKLFNRADAFLHMGWKTIDEFKKYNIASDKYHEVVWCGIEEFRFKPTITLGIVQNGEVEGKGLFFMNYLLNKFDFKNFKFIIQGVGWELLIKRFKDLGIRYDYRPNLQYDLYPQVYEQIDYLLIPSLWEGGPMAAIEAMYCGVPIISADVGWVKEISYSHLFEPGNYDGLIQILKHIEDKDIMKYENLDRYTCQAFSDRLANHFKRIVNG